MLLAVKITPQMIIMLRNTWQQSIKIRQAVSIALEASILDRAGIVSVITATPISFIHAVSTIQAYRVREGIQDTYRRS